MDNILALLIVALLVCIPVSIIKPKLFESLLHKHATRLKAPFIFFGCLILALILFDVTYKKTNSNVSQSEFPNETPVELNSVEQQYVASRSALVKQLVDQTAIIENDFQNKVSADKIAEDLQGVDRRWRKFLFGQFAIDVPSRFKNYNTLLDVSTSNAQYALEESACWTSRGDLKGATELKQTFDKDLIFLKNPPLPGDVYNDEIKQLQDESLKNSQAISGGLRCKLTLKPTISSDSTSLYITNPTNVEWDGCTVKIQKTIADDTGEFTSDSFNLTPNQIERIGWSNFTDSSGNRFDYFIAKPQNLVLDCTINALEAQSFFGL